MEINVIFASLPQLQHSLLPQDILGEGNFSVYHVKTASYDLDFDLAMKVFPKRNNLSSSSYKREKFFLDKLIHPNIIKYEPILKHNLNCDILLTEYTPNGDFFDFVINGGIFNEKLMRTYFHQLVEGIEYLHSQGVAHLDLKLENLLLDKNYCLKIFDFDQSQCIEDSQLRAGGTVGYRAPEMINRQCKDLKKVDMYAVGVILYAFQTLQTPFIEENEGNTAETASYKMFRDNNEKFWKEKSRELGLNFSNEMIDLLNGLWEENPERRFGVEEIKRTNWYNGEVYRLGEIKLEFTKILNK